MDVEVDGAEGDGVEADGAGVDGVEVDGAEGNGVEADGAEVEGVCGSTCTVGSLSNPCYHNFCQVFAFNQSVIR